MPVKAGLPFSGRFSLSREMLREGCRQGFVITIIIDAFYQYFVFKWFYPGETFVVAVIEAFIPV